MWGRSERSGSRSGVVGRVELVLVLLFIEAQTQQ